MKFREFFFTTDYTDYSDFIRWWIGHYTDSSLISQIRVVPTLKAIRMGFRQESKKSVQSAKISLSIKSV